MSEPFPPIPTPEVVPRRTGSVRDRHGRGPRGPVALPGPLGPAGSQRRRSRREEFDGLVGSLVEQLARRWEYELADVEFGTEDVPQLPDDWLDDPVPFGSYVPAGHGRPARIVLFRRPIELRAATRAEQAALVSDVLVDHVAELLGKDPGEVGP